MWGAVGVHSVHSNLPSCPNCGGELKIIAAIREAPVIERILTHLGLRPAGPGAATGAGMRDAPARGQASAQPLHSNGPALRAEGSGCASLLLGPVIAA